MSEQSISDLLYVGTVHVDVGYDGGGPTAETVEIGLGGMDLGGTIRVDLVRYAFGDEDLYKDDPPDGSVGMWTMLLTEMRDMLARCFLFGQMRVVSDTLGRSLDEEEEKNLDQAISELGDEDFSIRITPGLALNALLGRDREERAVRDGLMALVGFIEAQQDHPDEDITLEDATKRQQEGTERLERMAEDEDDEEGPST